MQAERGLEAGTRQIKPARNLERASEFVDGLLGGKLGALVEPLRHQQFGAGAKEGASAFDLNLGAHESLGRGVDDDSAKPERPDEPHRSFEKRNVPHSQTERHGLKPQSSALWVKKCLRLRCTSSVKTGSAMASSERGRGSGPA